MALYQKAVELDPAYVIAYNDLGVIYEAKGLPQRAEASYLRSIKIDPNYLSAYSNLALLYENRGDFDKASFYWSKRIELGSPDDSWTGKARQHLEYISLILGRANTAEVSDLSQKVIAQKALLVGDDKELAKVFLQRAEQSFKKQDYAAALKQAIDAMQLDPSNREIRSFVDKAQLRLLSR
jgi:tetratricopeptide (TPR) repeat protein